MMKNNFITIVYIYKNGIQVFKGSEPDAEKFLKEQKKMRELEIKILCNLKKLYSGYLFETNKNSAIPKKHFYGDREKILNNLGRDIYTFYTNEIPVYVKPLKHEQKKLF